MAAPNLAHGTGVTRTKWHAAWSVNMEPERARGIAPNTLAQNVSTVIRAVGGVLVEAPVGHACPEVTVQPLGMGLNRTVVTVQAWFSLGVDVAGSNINRLVADAFRNAGGGSDFPVEQVASAFNTCDDLSHWYQAIPGAGFFTTPAVGACCATFEAFTVAAPPAAGLQTSGRAVANPVSDSNNPALINTQAPVFVLPGGQEVSPTEFKIAMAVGGTIVALAVVGYFLRSVRGAVG